MRLITFLLNFVLLLSHIAAQWQAYLLGYLLIKDKGPKYNFQEDLGISDFQVSIVVGSCYTFVNGFANLFFGVLADQYPRKWIFTACTVAFTGMTLIESFCDSFVAILFARMGFACLMGSNIPLAVSLLSDYTLPRERGIAQSIYAAGVYLGVGMSSISILLDDHFGWRNCIRIVCGICWVLTIPVFFIPEPERNATNKQEAMEELQKVDDQFAHIAVDDTQNQTTETPLMKDANEPGRGSLQKQSVDIDRRMSEQNRRSSVFEVTEAKSFCERLKVLFSNKCFVYLVAAGAMRFFGGYSLGFLSGGFFEDRYPDYTSQFSVMNAVIVIGGGLPASMLGGWMSDAWEERYPNIKGLIAGVGALASAPFIVIAYGWQPSFWGSIAAYYVAYFVAEMWYGPSHAQINNMFPSEYQGFAVAAFNLGGAIAGTVATLTLGAIKTKLDTGDDEYDAKVNGWILTGGVMVSYLTCGPLFIISGNLYAKQLEDNKKKLAAEAMSSAVEHKKTQEY